MMVIQSLQLQTAQKMFGVGLDGLSLKYLLRRYLEPLYVYINIYIYIHTEKSCTLV